MICQLAVVGAGMAAARLLQALIEAGCRARITVFGAEPQALYNRIQLSSVLAGEQGSGQLPLLESGWFARHGIEVRSGEAVSELDVEGRRVLSSAGWSEAFDAIVLATGALPALPAIAGSELEGVMAFRTVADVQAMQAFASSSEQKRAVVLGGGLLGLEAAYGLNKQGVQVTVLHHRDRLMNRQLDAVAAGLLRSKMQAVGIRVMTETEVEAIAGTFRAEGLYLRGGEFIPAELIVLATGIVPNIALAQAAALEVERGVRVDAQMRCSAPGFYSLGECCQFGGETVGIVAPIAEQARVLAATLMGEAAQYQSRTYATQLKVSGIELFSAGDIAQDDAVAGERSIEIFDPDAGIYRRLAIRDNRLSGALLLGDKRHGRHYEQLIHQQLVLADKPADLIFNPQNL